MLQPPQSAIQIQCRSNADPMPQGMPIKCRKGCQPASDVPTLMPVGIRGYSLPSDLLVLAHGPKTASWHTECDDAGNLQRGRDALMAAGSNHLGSIYPVLCRWSSLPDSQMCSLPHRSARPPSLWTPPPNRTGPPPAPTVEPLTPCRWLPQCALISFPS